MWVVADADIGAKGELRLSPPSVCFLARRTACANGHCEALEEGVTIGDSPRACGTVVMLRCADRLAHASGLAEKASLVVPSPCARTVFTHHGACVLLPEALLLD